MAKTQVPGSQVTDATITEADIMFEDVTTHNATSAKHGLLPKLPNDATKFVNGIGNWATPSGSNQTLSISGMNLSISNGNTVALPDQTQHLSFSGSTLSIENGNSVTLPIMPYQLRRETVFVSHGEILTCHNAPYIELLPTPANDTYYSIKRLYIHFKPGSVVYSGTALIGYAGGMDYATVGLGVNYESFADTPVGSNYFGVWESLSQIADKGIVLRSPNNPITGGDPTVELRITIDYEIIDLTTI